MDVIVVLLGIGLAVFWVLANIYTVDTFLLNEKSYRYKPFIKDMTYIARLAVVCAVVIFGPVLFALLGCYGLVVVVSELRNHFVSNRKQKNIDVHEQYLLVREELENFEDRISKYEKVLK